MPPPTESPDLAALLGELVRGGVDFVVVGGVAAVLHGAPITTRDLDIVPDRSPANVRRLAHVLTGLDAVIRDPAGRRLRPTEELLSGPGPLLLATRLGPLDCLGTLHDDRGYAELVEHTVRLEDGAIEVRVLDLQTLIEIKAAAGRPKDRIVVPILLALLDERSPGD